MDEIQLLLEKIIDSALQQTLIEFLRAIDITNADEKISEILELAAAFSEKITLNDQLIVQNLINTVTSSNFLELQIAKKQPVNPLLAVEMACCGGELDTALNNLHAIIHARQYADNQQDLVMHNLGYLYALKKDWGTASRYFKQSLRLKENIATYADYARGALHNDQVELAKSLFVKTVYFMKDFDVTDLLVYFPRLEKQLFAEEDYLRIEMENLERFFIHPVPFACHQLIQLQHDPENYLVSLQSWVEQYLVLSEKPLAATYCRILSNVYERQGDLEQASKYHMQAERWACSMQGYDHLLEPTASTSFLELPSEALSLPIGSASFWTQAANIVLEEAEDPELAWAITESYCLSNRTL